MNYVSLSIREFHGGVVEESHETFALPIVIAKNEDRVNEEEFCKF